MATRSSDTLYISYLADRANNLLADARSAKRTNLPAVWLWGELDDAVAHYIAAAEGMSNGPRNKVGRQETLMGDAEDTAFALLLALAIEREHISKDFDSVKAFIVRIIDIRENEKSLEDLVWDERAVLWK